MENLIISLNAVMPFIIYIGYGYILKSFGAVEPEFMKKVNSMLFTAFFPFLLFNNLYKTGEIEFGGKLLWATLAIICGAILVSVFFTIKYVKDPAKRPVIVQAVFRSNFLLFAVPLAESIFGDEAVSVASLLVSVIVPFFNISTILLFEFFRGGKVKLSRLIIKVMKNPLIIGAVTGIAFVLLGIKLPRFAEKSIANFSALTTPLACFILGTQLELSSVKNNLKYILPTLFTKLVILPFIALFIAMKIGLSPAERFVMFSVFATPVATSSFPMARNMGGDGTLAGELVVTSTVGAVITLFVWIFAMGSAGILFA